MGAAVCPKRPDTKTCAGIKSRMHAGSVRARASEHATVSTGSGIVTSVDDDADDAETLRRILSRLITQEQRTAPAVVVVVNVVVVVVVVVAAKAAGATMTRLDSRSSVGSVSSSTTRPTSSACTRSRSLSRVCAVASMSASKCKKLAGSIHRADRSEDVDRAHRINQVELIKSEMLERVVNAKSSKSVLKCPRSRYPSRDACMASLRCIMTDHLTRPCCG